MVKGTKMLLNGLIFNPLWDK